MKSIFDLSALENFRKLKKLQPFRIKQIFFEIFKNSVLNFDDMSNLPKDLRVDLKQEFEILPLKVDKIVETQDTTKISFLDKNGDVIEAVIMYHLHDGSGETKLNRLTLCVSTQVGCPVGCSFCVTGKLGFKRNLSYEEIIGQLLFANNYIKDKLGKKSDKTRRQIRNVVFMGMGEPLLNYENTKKAVNTMLDQSGFSLSKRHITISTSGIIPFIQKLMDDGIEVGLAVSLHAPNQPLRESIMPIAKKYKLDDLMDILRKYIKITDNRIFYEYIMIDGITDLPNLAQELVKLLRQQNCHINLIPYNENPAIDYKESSERNIMKFKEILERGGLTVTKRQSMGREGKGACGQLGYEKLIG